MGALRPSQVASTLAVVLLAVLGYEVADGLGWLALGTQPGDGPRFARAVAGISFLAMLAGAAYAVVAAVRPSGSVRPWVLLTVAAVACLWARGAMYDPYYLPALERYADGNFSAGWMAVLTAATGMSTAIVLTRTRVGLVFYAVILGACAVGSTLIGLH